MSQFGIDFQRLRYWQGQRLRSEDLNAQAHYAEELHWWHNRAMHDAYGVSSGLEVSIEDDNVLVTAGLAYDCYGREIILAHPVTLLVPDSETDTNFDLVIARQTEGGSKLFWQPSSSFSIRDGVRLVRLTSNNELRRAGIQQRTRGLRRPHMGSGTTPVGTTPWRLWQVQGENQLYTLGIEVTVETINSGFQQTPCYFAQLRQQTEMAAENGGKYRANGETRAKRSPFIPGASGRILSSFTDISQLNRSTLFSTQRGTVPIYHVADASQDSFTFRVWLGSLLGNRFAFSEDEDIEPDLDNELLIFAQKKRYSVCWLGIEERG